MKFRSTLLVAFTLLIFKRASSQDVVNPYVVNAGYFNPINGPHLGNATYPFDYALTFPQVTNLRLSMPLYYKGEYEICMYKHFWWDYFDLENPLSDYSLTYEYEIVSFPFTKTCAFDNSGTGCANGSTVTRELTLPDPFYTNYIATSSEKYWEYTVGGVTWPAHLFNKTGQLDFPRNGYSGGVNSNGGPLANTLVSASFVQPGAMAAPSGIAERRIYPHTILKQTVNLHCGNVATNSNILTSFSFYSDNTRGRMRYYPFYPINANPGASAEKYYDEVFVPDFLANAYGTPVANDMYLHCYDELTTPNDIIMPNGTINYFRFNDIASLGLNCDPALKPTIPSDVFRNTDGSFWLGIESPYTVYSTPLRQYFGEYFAGYHDPGTGIAPMPSIRQDYLIDQNYDLNEVNSSNKTIYNPSEATITASDFHFPQDYTFKTIRGVYPTVAEVTAANIQANGFNCSGCDLRVIPANTDLTTESTTDAANFPLSLTTALDTKHLYASRYYLDNGGNTFPKLTIENCVGLFDCTFDVRQGSTMEFTDYTLHYGTEDNSYTNTASRSTNRFKIQTLGGAVLRNLAPVQYLQNGDISQTAPLHYTATQAIYAGGHLTDPDADINALSVNQDYVVQSGSDVTLEANDVVYLKDGFSAMSGSTFTAKIATTTLVAGTPCPSKAVYPRLAGNEPNPKKKTMKESLQAFPNPTTGVLKLVNNNRPVLAQEITITDTYGRTVFEKTNFNSLHDVIDFSSQPNGVYIAKIVSDSNSKPLRFVVNH